MVEDSKLDSLALNDLGLNQSVKIETFKYFDYF